MTDNEAPGISGMQDFSTGVREDYIETGTEACLPQSTKGVVMESRGKRYVSVLLLVLPAAIALGKPNELSARKDMNQNDPAAVVTHSDEPTAFWGLGNSLGVGASWGRSDGCRGRLYQPLR